MHIEYILANFLKLSNSLIKLCSTLLSSSRSQILNDTKIVENDKVKGRFVTYFDLGEGGGGPPGVPVRDTEPAVGRVPCGVLSLPSDDDEFHRVAGTSLCILLRW